MASGNDRVIDFEEELTPEERQRYRSRVQEIVAGSALVADLRKRKRIKPFVVRMLAQMYAQTEMLRIRAAAESKKLGDPQDRKTMQALVRFLDGSLRRSAKTLGLQ